MTKAVETIAEDIIDVEVYPWNIVSLATRRGRGWCSVLIRFTA
jgi:hypothetical protein